MDQHTKENKLYRKYQCYFMQQSPPLPEPGLMPKWKQNLGLNVAICRKMQFILGKKKKVNKLGEYQCHFCHITFHILQENFKNLKTTMDF